MQQYTLRFNLHLCKVVNSHFIQFNLEIKPGEKIYLAGKLFKFNSDSKRLSNISSTFSGFLTLLLVPESPYFLMSKYNDEKSARNSLDWLYNGDVDEIEKVMVDITEYQKKKSPKEKSDSKQTKKLDEKSKFDEKAKSDEELIISSTRFSSKKFFIIKIKFY